MSVHVQRPVMEKWRAQKGLDLFVVGDFGSGFGSHVVGFLRGGCSRGGGNWGTLRIPREDWGTLGNIRED